MSCDVSVGVQLQFARAAHTATLPQLGLPERVEALDRVLHPVLKWRDEYGSHIKLQTESADGADGVCKMVRSLKDVVVVELGISRHPISPPTLEQQGG